MMPTRPEDLEPGPVPVDGAQAVHDYHGRAAQAVRRLKYDRVMPHVEEMSLEMLALARSGGLDRADLVVPVPIHWSRRCERGFNQSELLAKPFDKRDLSVLRRVRRTRQQVGLTPEERSNNLAGAFSALRELRGRTILLIDDVRTSGGTARECAKTLKEAGALQVYLLTYCAGGSVHDP